MNELSAPLFGERTRSAPDRARFGEKGAYLHWLAERGERVPKGFVLEPGVVLDVQAGKHAVLSASLARLCAELDSSEVLAVRASPTMALPGALKTVLEVRISKEPDETLENVLGALALVVASAKTPEFSEQLHAHGLALPDEPWLAVIVQRMICVRDDSGFGLVAHSRSPLSGNVGLVGQYVRGRGARAVVGGQTRPRPMLRSDAPRARPDDCLEAEEPEIVVAVRALLQRLESELAHPVEIEAVYDGSALWLVEARPAVLSVRGWVRTALDGVESGTSFDYAVAQLVTKSPRDLMEARLPPPEVLGEANVIARGLAASPGVASGVLCIDAERVLNAPSSSALVLMRRDAVPEDVALFRRASALVTTSGGLTSHAAVIARGLSLPAVVGSTELFVEPTTRTVRRAIQRDQPILHEGDAVTVDAHRGIVYRGVFASEPVIGSAELRALLAKTAPLRARPLWTLGSARAASRASEDCSLSGTVVRMEADTTSLPHDTSWVLVTPQLLETAVRVAPQSGICFAHARPEDLRAFRLRFPERRLGVLLSAGDAEQVSVDLDLAIVSNGYTHSAPVSAKVRLWLVDEFEKGATRAGHSPEDGLICAPEQAAKWALGLLIRP